METLVAHRFFPPNSDWNRAGGSSGSLRIFSSSAFAFLGALGAGELVDHALVVQAGGAVAVPSLVVLGANEIAIGLLFFDLRLRLDDPFPLVAQLVAELAERRLGDFRGVLQRRIVVGRALVSPHVRLKREQVGLQLELAVGILLTADRSCRRRRPIGRGGNRRCPGPSDWRRPAGPWDRTVRTRS